MDARREAMCSGVPVLSEGHGATVAMPAMRVPSNLEQGMLGRQAERMVGRVEALLGEAAPSFGVWSDAPVSGPDGPGVRRGR
jgi:hypothetical protein